MEVNSCNEIYGFQSPDSDYDLCGAHVLPLDAVVGLEVRDETVQRAMRVAGPLTGCAFISIYKQRIKTHFHQADLYRNH